MLRLRHCCGGCVPADPKSLELYVDGHPVDAENSEREYNNITHVNITCAVSGGHPEPIVTIRVNEVEVEPISGHAVCRPQPSELPAFLPVLTCSATVTVEQFMIDYITSGRVVTCTARSRGSADVRLSTSFVPRLTGGMCLLRSISPVRLCQQAVLKSAQRDAKPARWLLHIDAETILSI